MYGPLTDALGSAKLTADVKPKPLWLHGQDRTQVKRDGLHKQQIVRDNF